MRVALCTRSFRPEIGGLGTVSHAYALGLLELGCQPRVVTSTPPAPEGYDGQFPYPVVRQPGYREFRRVLRDSDCVVFIHQSLVYVLWSLFVGKPVVSSIQGRIWNWGSAFNAFFSIFCEMHLRFRPHAVLVSDAIRSPATRRAPVIGNPYDADVFHQTPAATTPNSIIFSGRLNRGKGVFHLVEAAKILRGRGLEFALTFVGSGPHEAELRDAVVAADLGERTRFVGHCEPPRVAELLTQHPIAAIPSDWDEPFGIVALEAIACGCYVVAFPDGGLPFAVGDAGVVTGTKSPEALADAIQRLLTDEMLRQRIDGKRAKHLERFSRKNVALGLLEVMNSACRRPSSKSK
ncbi:MAG: glycosyltransferase family 4 protein [Chthoniobacteraceae bacterium]